MSNFNTDIRFLKGVGEKRAQHLYSLGIDTIGALLRYFPRGYEDFSNIKQIFDCNVDEKVCVKAKIITPITENKIRKNMTLYRFTVSDNTAHMQVTIFNNKYLAARLHQGSEYLFLGKIQSGTFLRVRFAWIFIVFYAEKLRDSDFNLVRGSVYRLDCRGVFGRRIAIFIRR